MDNDGTTDSGSCTGTCAALGASKVGQCCICEEHEGVFVLQDGSTRLVQCDWD